MNEREGFGPLTSRGVDMKSFRITIEIDSDTTTEKTAEAYGLGDLLSRGLDMLKRDEAGREYVIPASKIVKIAEILGKDKEKRVY